MSDTMKNGTARLKWIIPIVMTAALAAIGWLFAAQAWAKDAGHDALNQRISINARDISECKDTNKELLGSVRMLEKNQSAVLANQEQMFKALERLEKLLK